MSPEDARQALRATLPWESWIDTELISCSPREKRRLEREVAAEKSAADVRRAEVEAVASLPDSDLAWLLDNGWRP